MEMQVETFDGDQAARVHMEGPIDIDAARSVWDTLDGLAERPTINRIVLDFSDVTLLDSAGIATFSVGVNRLRDLGIDVRAEHLSREHRKALDLMPSYREGVSVAPEVMGVFAGVGDVAMGLWKQFKQFYDTLTDAVFAALRMFKGQLPPKGSITRESVKLGVDALPIIALLSLLLGLILAFQSAHQLRQFGANIYVANLVSIAMVREFGPMMTGIILAGRSGSSMAAELSTMKIQEEIDALKTMGIDPDRYLVLPRLIGITIVQPMLTLMSMAIGVSGGYIIARFYLGLSTSIYWNKSFAALDMGDLGHGLGKSVIFAWIIGIIACYSGMAVRGGASAVGRATTRAVVAAIFMIIVADSFFATMVTLIWG